MRAEGGVAGHLTTTTCLPLPFDSLSREEEGRVAGGGVWRACNTGLVGRVGRTRAWTAVRLESRDDILHTSLFFTHPVVLLDNTYHLFYFIVTYAFKNVSRPGKPPMYSIFKQERVCSLKDRLVVILF